MSYVKKEQLSVSRIIINSIKEYMLLHVDELVPTFRLIQELKNVPEDFKTIYPMLKRRAFKELEKVGYILHYDAATQAKIKP